MILENSIPTMTTVVILMPFIICFVYRTRFYKELTKKLKVDNRLLSKKVFIYSMIWFVLFSLYLLFIDSLSFELGSFWLLSYLSFPVIIMLFGGTLYNKSIISIVFTLGYGIWTYLILTILGKLGYYEQFLRIGEPTSPLISGIFIVFGILVAIIYLVAALTNTVVEKFTKNK